MLKTAVVLAGGLGTRLRPLTDRTPKPMLPVAGKPIVQHIVDLLRAHGFSKIILSIGYRGLSIIETFKGQEDVEFAIEREPMGTGGAVRLATADLDEPVLVLNGDNLADYDLHALYEHHKRNSADVTLALYPVEDVTQYGIVEMDGDRIRRFVEKPKAEDAPSNLNNAGAYVMEPHVYKLLPEGKSMIERFFEEYCAKGKVVGFRHEGQWYPTDDLAKYRVAQENFS